MGLKPEVKKSWVDALRNGKYAQCVGFLRANESYCCLGVLCDVAGADWDQRHEDDAYIAVLLGESEDTEVPSGYAHEIGLTFVDQKKLINLNDSGKSFEEIASYIEEHL